MRFLAGLAGASVAINGGFGGIDLSADNKVLLGLLFSSAVGFVCGYGTSKATVAAFSGIERDKSEGFFKISQIASSAVMAFMHGAQDTQKFAGVLTLEMLMMGGGRAGEWVFPVCAVIMSLGTALGGGRITRPSALYDKNADLSRLCGGGRRAASACFFQRFSASPSAPLTPRPPPSWASGRQKACARSIGALRAIWRRRGSSPFPGAAYSAGSFPVYI